MALPPLDATWHGTTRDKPRINVLEVRAREQPEGVPIAWVLIERQVVVHRDGRDGTIAQASIRLSYECITPHQRHRNEDKGFFAGGYSRGALGQPFVSLTSESLSKGPVFLDPRELRGYRVGTYLMNEIVTWAKQWPDATVRSVELLSGQSEDENKVRRNRFYEQFGLVFDYRDPEHREGLSRPMYASGLKSVETWKKNLQEREIPEFIGAMLEGRERLQLQLLRQEQALERMRGERRLADEKPIRWALRRLWMPYSHAILVSAILSGMTVIVWFSTRA